MEANLIEFFKTLVETPSPSGFEQKAQGVFREFVSKYADEVKTDVHGNTMALKKGTGKLRLMISGHADEIGLMVKYIDDNGYIRFSPIGGIDFAILPSLRVNIYHEDKMYRGVIGRKPIHLLESEERTRAIKREDLWIDFGAKNKADAESKVSVGDYITFSPGMEFLNDDFVTTKATDNKAGVFVAAAVLKELENEKLCANVYAVSTVQEEIGIRGAKTSAFEIDPHVGIAVDVTFSSDYPGIDKNVHGDIKLGKGAVISIGPNINPKVAQLLKLAAKETETAYQLQAAPGATGTDANAIQLSRSGVAAGLVSIPNRYMHTTSEVIALSDLEAAVKIIAQFARLLTDETDFIPK